MKLDPLVILQSCRAQIGTDTPLGQAAYDVLDHAIGHMIGYHNSSVTRALAFAEVYRCS